MDHDPETLTELDLPDGVHEAGQAVEVLRAWVADGALQVVCDPETFRDNVPDWGRLLADIAHHVAYAVALDGQMEQRAALGEIHAAFERGIGRASETMRGNIKGRTRH